MASIIVCIVLLAISVLVISFGVRYFVVKLNDRIDVMNLELEHLMKRIDQIRDRTNNELHDRYSDYSYGDMKVITIRGRLDDLTEDMDLLKQYLNVEKVDTPASTKFVKRKGNNG